MDFTGWVPPEIKIGCGIIIALVAVIVALLAWPRAKPEPVLVGPPFTFSVTCTDGTPKKCNSFVVIAKPK
jgi:hypothetical protein